MSEKIIEPIIKPPKIEVDKKLLEDIKEQTDKEKQVIVHCYFYPEQFFSRIRIWHSTYLKDLNSDHRSKLLDAHNINFYPSWKPIIGMAKVSFTLVFEGLNSECQSFRLVEDIPVNNGFFTGTITRNETDVYQVQIMY
ncbi:MAG: hypothetical protein ACOCWG_01050 [bacterium]